MGGGSSGGCAIDDSALGCQYRSGSTRMQAPLLRALTALDAQPRANSGVLPFVSLAALAAPLVADRVVTRGRPSATKAPLDSSNHPLLPHLYNGSMTAEAFGTARSFRRACMVTNSLKPHALCVQSNLDIHNTL